MEKETINPSQPTVIRLLEIDSTNEFLKRNQNSLKNGTVVLAEHQTKGKGRRGLVWTSIPGKSLLFSMLIKPLGVMEPVTNFSICPAIAIIRALSKFDIKAAVKWPNDIMINGRKIAGILVESSWASETLNAVIIGVGLNVTQTPTELEGLSDAGSIYTQTEKIIDREQLFEFIYKEFRQLSDYLQLKEPFTDLIQEWLSFCEHLNSPVQLLDNAGNIYGIFKGINQNGEAIIETADQQRHIFKHSRYKMRKNKCC